jgi:DNA-binding transcriptional LysR family regulator
MFRTTLRRLEVFVAAVEAGGFRACSDRLDISQAAVSHHVKQLEDELGYPLFVRRRGAVAGVSDKGVVAYRQAKDLLEDAGRLTRLDGRPAGGPRRLSILTDAVLDGHLARRIAAYLGEDRTFELVLRQSYFEEMSGAFGRGESDVVYFYSCGPVAEFESSFCWSEPLSICAREDHPLHGQGPVGLDEVARYPFIAPPGWSHFRRSVDGVLRQFGMGSYPVLMEMSNARLAREAVISGLAISAVITRYLDEELSRFGVKAVPLRTPPLSLEVRRAVRRELRFDPAFSRVLACLDQSPQQSAAAVWAPLAREPLLHAAS